MQIFFVPGPRSFVVASGKDLGGPEVVGVNEVCLLCPVVESGLVDEAVRDESPFVAEALGTSSFMRFSSVLTLRLAEFVAKVGPVPSSETCGTPPAETAKLSGPLFP